jgi:hypothetical protein
VKLSNFFGLGKERTRVALKKKSTIRKLKDRSFVDLILLSCPLFNMLTRGFFDSRLSSLAKPKHYIIWMCVEVFKEVLVIFPN